MRACKIDDCENEHAIKGLCSKHYQRLRRTGTTDRKVKPEFCNVTGCKSKTHSSNMCHKHYCRLRITGTTDSPFTEFCKLKGCNNKHHSCGLCAEHYYIENRESIIIKRKENRVSIAKNKKQWREDNPDKIKVYGYKRRALKLAQLGHFNLWMLSYFRYIQEDACYYCGLEMLRDTPNDDPRKENLEHLTPLSRGGMHCWTNTVLACAKCNLSKATKTMEEFMEYRA